jgi:hypothetical protein
MSIRIIVTAAKDIWHIQEKSLYYEEKADA